MGMPLIFSDRLGVVTRTLFAQRDFSDLSILDAFYESLQGNLKSQLTESAFYMGKFLWIRIIIRWLTLDSQEPVCE